MSLVIRPVKRLGQNFLRDPNTARRIVAALDVPETEPVVEVGPGTGALTGILAARFGQFAALEVDDRAVAHLRETLPGVDVRQADVLEADWKALADEMGRPLHVISNLPYYITSEILFGLVDARAHIGQAVVMMQKEVARRIVAVPRTKEYGILSVVLQRVCLPKLLFDVSPNVFYPKPEVTSSVLRLDFRAGPHDDVDPAWFRTVVRTAFNQRRKTLRNSLSRLEREVPEHWRECRAEELTPADFVEMTRYLAGASHPHPSHGTDPQARRGDGPHEVGGGS